MIIIARWILIFFIVKFWTIFFSCLILLINFFRQFFFNIFFLIYPFFCCNINSCNVRLVVLIQIWWKFLRTSSENCRKLIFVFFSCIINIINCCKLLLLLTILLSITTINFVSKLLVFHRTCWARQCILCRI